MVGRSHGTGEQGVQSHRQEAANCPACPSCYPCPTCCASGAEEGYSTCAPRNLRRTPRPWKAAAGFERTGFGPGRFRAAEAGASSTQGTCCACPLFALPASSVFLWRVCSADDVSCVCGQLMPEFPSRCACVRARCSVRVWQQEDMSIPARRRLPGCARAPSSAACARPMPSALTSASTITHSPIPAQSGAHIGCKRRQACRQAAVRTGRERWHCVRSRMASAGGYQG